MSDDPLRLYDPRNGDLSLRIASLEPDELPLHPQRFNTFSLYWIQGGSGTFWADATQYRFDPGVILFFVPYQGVRIIPDAAVGGRVIQFHANFLCIETHHEEVGCNGVLFNDVYGEPMVRVDEGHAREFAVLIESMRSELEQCGLAHAEILLSYLKILLVKATRLKCEQQVISSESPARRPKALDDLRLLIEDHFRDEHSPTFYANRLHLATKSLAKLVKTHHHKTPTQLIRERVMRQAKWDLLHTLKPVKQIAAEVGFEDELYFSRLFKQATGCSPTFFREFETRIRDGKNVWVP
ncbi:helix-turn-helix domain-containing protein [Singulisphaera sp. PoT]|uniref:helix-turn-helix domain-containing protein n=1 Tax=Singulisphaera sp. PoT TaxID=3411797 RepID=UPI003BF4C995